jgi:hypothetical protein
VLVGGLFCNDSFWGGDGEVTIERVLVLDRVQTDYVP